MPKMTVAITKPNLHLLIKNLIIRVDGECLKLNAVNECLGAKLDENMNFHNHIDRGYGRAARIMHKIFSIAKREYAIPLPITKLYINATVTLRKQAQFVYNLQSNIYWHFFRC